MKVKKSGVEESDKLRRSPIESFRACIFVDANSVSTKFDTQFGFNMSRLKFGVEKDS